MRPQSYSADAKELQLESRVEKIPRRFPANAPKRKMDNTMPTKPSQLATAATPELRPSRNDRVGKTRDRAAKPAKHTARPRAEARFKVRIVTDPITGLPVLSAGKNAPVLTSKQVAELLQFFP
jgi:hypothetical protein